MKKETKILIILLVLIIIGLTAFIVVDKFIINKGESAESVNTSENETNNQVLQEGGNNSENEINENFTNNATNSTKNEVSNTTQNQSTNALSTQETLALGNEMYKKANKCYWDGVEGDYGNLIYNIDESGNPYYKITNIDEIKSVLINNAFSNFCSEKGVKEKNGEYYIVAAGRGDDVSYLGNELEVDTIAESKIIFTSIEKYCANEEDYGVYNDASEVEDIITKEYKFVIVKENGSWKVSEFTLPD